MSYKMVHMRGEHADSLRLACSSCQTSYGAELRADAPVPAGLAYCQLCGREQEQEHQHEYTRSKPSATVETCACRKWRHTENAGPAIVETRERWTLAQFLKRECVTARAVRVAYDARQDGEDWRDAGARHFVVTLRRGRKSMRVRFHQGSAYTEDPTAADVLDCLASDAAGYENARGFVAWAQEYGYDVDSRRAEKTYKTIARQAARLRAFLTDEKYDVLLWQTERA